ncbi:MAG: AAA family ATPase [Candidatus Dojkabacteria bacterium]|nr:MAG: AAA family ATPase [Candidatus Dojkabacteria bacterium]
MGYLIVVGGHEGAGASTISKMMARNLGMHLFSDEVILRDIAAQNGYSSFNKFLLSDYYNEHYEELYSMLDDKLIQASSWHNLIIESRYFAVIAHKLKIACTVRIWLEVDIDKRARRYLHRVHKLDIGKKLSTESKMFKEVVTSLETDLLKETKRITKKYQVDCSDPSKYNDIVFNSTAYNAGDTFNKLLTLIYDGKYLSD